MDCNFNIQGELLCKENFVSQSIKYDINNICSKIGGYYNKNFEINSCKNLIKEKIIDKCRVCLYYDYNSEECDISYSGLNNGKSTLNCKDSLKLVGINEKYDTYFKAIRLENHLKTNSNTVIKNDSLNNDFCLFKKDSPINPCLTGKCIDPFSNIDCLLMTEIYCNEVIKKNDYIDKQICDYLMKDMKNTKISLLTEYYDDKKIIYDQLTNVPTQKITNVPTQKITNVPTQKVTDVSTQKVTDVSTQKVTKIPKSKIIVTEEPINPEIELLNKGDIINNSIIINRGDTIKIKFNINNVKLNYKIGIFKYSDFINENINEESMIKWKYLSDTEVSDILSSDYTVNFPTKSQDKLLNSSYLGVLIKDNKKIAVTKVLRIKGGKKERGDLVLNLELNDIKEIDNKIYGNIKVYYKNSLNGESDKIIIEKMGSDSDWFRESDAEFKYLNNSNEYKSQIGSWSDGFVNIKINGLDKDSLYRVSYLKKENNIKKVIPGKKFKFN